MKLIHDNGGKYTVLGSVSKDGILRFQAPVGHQKTWRQDNPMNSNISSIRFKNFSWSFSDNFHNYCEKLSYSSDQRRELVFELRIEFDVLKAKKIGFITLRNSKDRLSKTISSENEVEDFKVFYQFLQQLKRKICDF